MLTLLCGRMSDAYSQYQMHCWLGRVLQFRKEGIILTSWTAWTKRMVLPTLCIIVDHWNSISTTAASKYSYRNIQAIIGAQFTQHEGVPAYP